MEKQEVVEAVKITATNFINSRKRDRIGIIVFAGESFIQCPLTVDKSVLKSLIDEILRDELKKIVRSYIKKSIGLKPLTYIEIVRI